MASLDVSLETIRWDLLSMALTGCAITYGVGQIISGIFGDRISPKKLITYGLIVTVCMNTLIPFCQNHYQITAVWCVNGFAQAFMWPPLVRLMSTIFTIDDYKTAAVKVSCGSSVGTILVYLISPVLITTIGWKPVFWCCALCRTCMIWIWNRYCCYSHFIEQNTQTNTESTKKDDTDLTPKTNRSPSGNLWKSILSPVMIGIMFAIVLHGMLRDGVTTWLPTYISETYH